MRNRKLNQNKKLITSFANWLQHFNIYWLVISPLVMSLIMLAGFLFIGDKVYGEKLPEDYMAVTGAVCVLIGSASGVFQVIRREGPGPFGEPVNGFWPVVSGIILIVICWAVAIYLLSYALT